MIPTHCGTRDLAMVGLAAAMLCIAGPVVVPLFFSPVPLSLATLAIYFSACLLGWKKATAGCLVYLLLGLAGMPIFSGFSAGLPRLAGPTGGYLMGYVLLAALSGLAAERFFGRRLWLVAGMALATGAFYAVGTAWLARVTGVGFGAALMMGVVPFLPGDAAKILAAAAVAPVVRSRLARAGLL